MKPSAWIIKLLLVAMSLGTAWAVRGQFGHEHGAAWAGGIGVLSLLILSDRQDWYKRLPTIVALGAIGWGVGGMMSYGLVVGYGRSMDLPNVSYGLLGLFVIGGLYGFIGGGMTGLSLASSPPNKVDWASLITQMIAGAYLIWGILIYQLEWLMTPPRSELWAACLGAALALAWYAFRHQYYASLKVAICSGLGAGFGFAFGNFLQVLGSTSGIQFNWWNVMEYSLGFFGGLGMAWGVFTEKWPEKVSADRYTNHIGWVFIIFILPMINIIEAFGYDKLLDRAENLGVDATSFVNLVYFISWGSLLIIAPILSWVYRNKGMQNASWSRNEGILLWSAYLAWFILLSNVMGAIWLNGGGLKEYLYWANLIVILIGMHYSVSTSEMEQHNLTEFSFKKAFRLGTSIILIIFVLSLILVNAHEDLPGAQSRFILWE